MSKIIKRSFVAYNWEEYESQGPDYVELAEWWRQNAVRLPGDYTSDYNSWARWYRDKYHNQWGNRHVGPVKAMEILEEEASTGLAYVGDRIKERTRRLLDWSKERFGRGGAKRKLRGGSGNYTGVVDISPKANVENTTDEVKEFLAAIGNLAKERGYAKPHVTSGYRSVRGQIRAMAYNWNKYGGAKPVSDQEARVLERTRRRADTVDRIRTMTQRPINLGLLYFFELYQDKEMAVGMNEIFMEMGTGRQGIKAGKEFWESLGRAASSHLRSPATSVDLALTSGIKEVLNEVYESGEFKMKKPLFEENHYHVRIYS
nr:hypothetical protein 49 [bacterium]